MKKKILLGLFLAAGLAVPAAKAVAQITDPVEPGSYDASIGADGKIRCIKPGTNCLVA